MSPRLRPIRGFTLIELLVVIAVLGILAAVTVAVSSGVREKARIGRTRAELAVVAQALEAYRRQFGDYPRTTFGMSAQDASERLFNSLAGNLRPDGSTLAQKGRVYLDFGRLRIVDNTGALLGGSGTGLPTDFETVTTFRALRLADGFDRPVRYRYGDLAGWTYPGFLLWSEGPNGASELVVSASAPPAVGTPSVPAGSDDLLVELR